jgi:hypothetical protein
VNEVPAALRPPLHGVRLWYAVLAGIVLWMVHLFVETSLARIRCSHEWVSWLIHGVTVVLALGTILAMVWSWGLWRTYSEADEDNSDAEARWQFLGLFGFLTGAVSLLVIVWEGAYVPFLRACGA